MLFWNLNYRDSASTMAGEVERPERTFPRALAVAVVLIAAGYLLPLMAAIGATDAPPETWVNGYLADAAGTYKLPLRAIKNLQTVPSRKKNSKLPQVWSLETKNRFLISTAPYW